jgi:hypothetical protein
MHPRLSRLLEELALDNGMELRPRPRWPPESAKLEDSAARLCDDGVDHPSRYREKYRDEYELLASGGSDDIEDLVYIKGLQELNEFLNEAFDGKYRYWFFL